MKKLLFQLDTDSHASVFDTVVGYDGGSDHVVPHANINPENVRALVEGAIFTRSPKEKKNTAVFIGGSNLPAGEALLTQVQKYFFADFKVSVMLDSNGSNTTAAAAVAKVTQSYAVQGKKAVILAGTGPVGMRSAYMLSKEGATVTITSRTLASAQKAQNNIKKRFGVDVEVAVAADNEARSQAVQDANIVIATGAAEVMLLEEKIWKESKTIQILADANATPPLGIQGLDMGNKGKEVHGKITWGALGFGVLKLTLHRECIARLFHTNDQVFDAENIFELAKKMAQES